MHGRVSVILFIIAFVISSCTGPRITIRSLKSDIERQLSAQKGIYAVAFKNLSTGDALMINEHDVFHAASTMKTPVLIEVYRQSTENFFSLSDSIIIKNKFKSIVDGSSYSLDPTDDSEKELYKRVGEKKTISELVYDMIIVSSNLATNIIMELVDAKNVTQTMRNLGAKDIQVLRGVEDGKAFAKGLNNTTTAYDLFLLFEKMAKGEIINAHASEAMINILLDQRFNEIIPAGLPSGVKVAHKTGNITGVFHDSGIIFLPDGKKYVLVLLSKNVEDEKLAIQSMTAVSTIIYNYVRKK